MQYDHDTVRKIFQASLEADATDVHFKVPGAPRFRVGEQLVAAPFPKLMPADTIRVAQVLQSIAKVELPLAHVTERTLSFGIPGLGRFRAQMYRQRGSLSLVVHRMKTEAPTLESLGSESAVGKAIWSVPGLTLVTGRTQRLATLAALVDHYNRSERGFLVSLEHPLEYLHTDRRAMVSQREIGQDTDTIAEGLQWALTSDVDAVVVADLPTPKDAELALRVAESGRRVVASLAGCPPQEAIAWFLQLFPSERRSEIQHRLRRSLRFLAFERGDELKVAPAERLFARARAS